MELSKARRIACTIVEQLKEHTSRIHIAGSIRREKYDVKDIEIVCLPLMKSEVLNDLFGGETIINQVDAGFFKTANSIGAVIKGKPDGKYMQIGLKEGILLDLFISDADDYFRQYAIRTGSRDYVAGTIATAWNRKGWCGSDHGLRLMRDCKKIQDHPSCKPKWLCINPDAEKPPVWQNEKEFFQWIGVPWIQPSTRSI